LGEAEQRVAIVFILLATQGDLSRQTFRNRVRQRVETVEDVDNATLLGQRGMIIFARSLAETSITFAPLANRFFWGSSDIWSDAKKKKAAEQIVYLN